jgi:5-methyltetrahydropteroyltriglutamate--homocysteine methyltransferase
VLARDDHYGDPARLSMAYAEVVNTGLHEMQAAGIDRALEGITVPTVVHLCFGYAAGIKMDNPIGYSFLPELERCRAPRSRSRPPSRGSISRCCARCRP